MHKCPRPRQENLPCRAAKAAKKIQERAFVKPAPSMPRPAAVYAGGGEVLVRILPNSPSRFATAPSKRGLGQRVQTIRLWELGQAVRIYMHNAAFLFAAVHFPTSLSEGSAAQRRREFGSQHLAELPQSLRDSPLKAGARQEGADFGAFFNTPKETASQRRNAAGRNSLTGQMLLPSGLPQSSYFLPALLSC